MRTYGDDFNATRNGKEGNEQDNASTFHDTIQDRGSEGERKEGEIKR
jgi:hypothetical protein